VTAHYRLPASSIDALVWGDTEILQTLRSVQWSRRLLLLRAIVRTATERQPTHIRTGRVADGLELLAWVQRDAPQAANEIVTYPLVGVWLQRCLRRLRGVHQGPDPGPLWHDLAQLNAVAAAAALSSGQEFTAEVPLRSGELWLPGLGRAVFPAGDEEWATVARDGKGAYARAGAQEIRLPDDAAYDEPLASGWEPVRPLAVGRDELRLELSLDDVDPGRYCFGVRPADRLESAAVLRWSLRLGQAWTRLVRDHPRHALALRAGLRALVPLARSDRDVGVSVSARAVFGAAALTEPSDSVAFCVSLIHELRHTMLNGLLDLVPLHDDGGDGIDYSPWRSDPRPLGGLLHGAYAFVGVADFWRVHRGLASGDEHDRADFEFLRTREQIRRAIGTLVASARLTAVGERLVELLTGVVESWAEESAAVGPALPAQVGQALALHQFTWRVQNVPVDRDELDSLAVAWLAALPCPPVGAAAVSAGGEVTFTDAAGWDRLRAGEAVDPPEGTHSAEAAAALADGDHALAAQSFRRALATDPGSHLDWAGLLHSLAHLPDTPAARMLSARPELVAAVCHTVLSRSGRGADPLLVAAWIAQSAGGNGALGAPSGA
jgi:HEXXH motif-containing protein